MKKLLLSSLIPLIVLMGCSKKNETPAAQFSFKADGTLYVFNGDYYAQKGSQISPQTFLPGLYFIGQNTSDNYLGTYIMTNTLDMTTYSVSFALRLNAVDYDSAGNCSVTITKLQNNRATGFFSGEMFLHRQIPTPVVISEGQFANVPIRP